MRIASPFDCGIRNCHVDDLHESFLAFASFCLTRYALHGECRETINVKPPPGRARRLLASVWVFLVRRKLCAKCVGGIDFKRSNKWQTHKRRSS